MKKFARIENNIVLEVIEAEEKPEFHPSIILIECPADTDQDFIYENYTFKRKEINISELKTNKKYELNALAGDKIEGGFNFENNDYQIDAQARESMLAIYTYLNAGVSNPHAGSWRTTDNTMIEMDDTKVRAFIDAVFVYNYSLKVVLWGHKDAIQAMTRSEDVADYDITQAWPSNG